MKIAYLGKRYKGFAHNAGPDSSALPTIERELWKALKRARLILPSSSAESEDGNSSTDEVNWDGCEYSKCGRTDKGVSAFGQVVGIRVRSTRPRPSNDPRQRRAASAFELAGEEEEEEEESEAMMHETTDNTASRGSLPTSTGTLNPDNGSSPPFDDVADELPYAQMLNRILPDDIRVLAWCPSPPPGFSARFACRERQYRYFFTQPAFGGHQGRVGDRQQALEGWLDIEAMRQAAKSLIGLHDFRNFCKVDPTKQTTNYERRIFHADIMELDPSVGVAGYGELKTDGLAPRVLPDHAHETNRPPRVYAFVVHGSAFLWHQVRHMAAVLFLIGQGLESVSLITQLLDVRSNPCKPAYGMAAEEPLVLWDCIFPGSEEKEDAKRKDALDWVYIGDVRDRSVLARANDYELSNLLEGLWTKWRRQKMNDILMGSLLEVLLGRNGKLQRARGDQAATTPPFEGSRRRNRLVFDGGDSPRPVGQYVPVLEQVRREPVETINRKYAARKGQDHSAPAPAPAPAPT